VGAGADGLVDGAADCGRQRDKDDLGAFATHSQHPMAMLFTRSLMSAPVASKIRRPSSPSIATSAKSQVFVDSRAAVRSASNCR
jgi:hypothetical protein